MEMTFFHDMLKTSPISWVNLSSWYFLVSSLWSSMIWEHVKGGIRFSKPFTSTYVVWNVAKSYHVLHVNYTGVLTSMPNVSEQVCEIAISWPGQVYVILISWLDLVVCFRPIITLSPGHYYITLYHINGFVGCHIWTRAAYCTCIHLISFNWLIDHANISFGSKHRWCTMHWEYFSTQRILWSFWLCLQVKETIHRLKEGFKETLKDKDDITTRKLENLAKDKDKGD